MKKKLPGLNEKILVVGGTGFIGYILLKRLKKEISNVHSISLHNPKIIDI